VKIKYVLVVWVVMLAGVLCGCQKINQKRAVYVRDRGQDYLTHTILPPLKVPEGYSHPQVTENFPLPEPLPEMGTLTPVSVVPPGFGQWS